MENLLVDKKATSLNLLSPIELTSEYFGRTITIDIAYEAGQLQQDPINFQKV